jgi:ABC-type microcin C transport system duplicated ATPase subunit YejF
VAAGRDDDRRQPFQQGQVLAHVWEQRLRQVGVGVDQPRQHHPVAVADHLGAREPGRHLGEGPDGQHLAGGEGDRAVLQVAGRPHGQQVPATDDNDLFHGHSLGSAAVDGVDLRVLPGDFVSVVGPSGCGKSTPLRVASGLTPVTGGTLDIQTGKIGYVFQDPTLLPWRTVRRNVELFAELRDLPKNERRRRAAAAIELVGLGEFAGHRPRTLSGGMRMRVSLARSLTLQPELFLFDEPFGAWTRSPGSG